MKKNKNIICHIQFLVSIGIQFYWLIKLFYLTNVYYASIVSLLFLALTSFFIFFVVNIIYNLIVPYKWIQTDSEYLSFNEPNNMTETNLDLENQCKQVIVTIQIPVYTESFDNVLESTFNNVALAVKKFNETSKHYIVNVFINDDGLQVVPFSEAEKRIKYYKEHLDFFYIGRPKDGRAGKFKKASNMNFCLNQVNNANKYSKMNFSKKIKQYQEQFNFLYSENIDFEIGKYILLLDSDSKIGDNIIQNLINEMEYDEKIGFIQMKTIAKLTTKNNFWEKIIGHFTNIIYNICFLHACSNGFSSPLVGHNCMLKWSVIQKITYDKKLNCENQYIYWDETKVSEDFAMSLNMQSHGYYGKYIYYDCGFTEGVTLNVIDEISKFSKFAYGVNEIIFNPISEWFNEGILNDTFNKFICVDKINLSAKYAMLSYMFSYYSIALAPIFTIINYFMYAYSDKWNDFVNNSFYGFISCVIIFLGAAPISNIIAKIKLGSQDIIKVITDEIVYGICLTLFFGGISYHLLIIIIKHFLNLNASWKTTNKELNLNNKLAIIYSFKLMYFICILLLLLIFILWFVPAFGSYQITSSISIIPLLVTTLLHILMPLIL
jgi:hypothetical protein